jgi:hypothetical protein
MSDLRVIVHAGSDVVPAHVDVGIPDDVPRRALLSAESTLTFVDAGGETSTIDLADWRVRQSRRPEPGFPSRFALIAPDRLGLQLRHGSQATLRLAITGGTTHAGSGLVIGDSPPSPQGGVIAEAREAVDAVSLYAAYPILTSPGPDGGSGAGTPAGGGDARAIVQREWRNVLGRVPRDGDVAGMLAALDRRFVETDADGVDGWTYVPGSYVGQNDVGAGVTGAQASLASFANRVGEEIGTYVAEAQPLRMLDENPEEVDIARAGFWASWQSFVASLGDEGGLPAARSAVLLRQAREQLVRFGIQLGMFEQGALEVVVSIDGGSEIDAIRRIPISREFVLTRDDEERLTNFLIVRDRVAAVARAFAETIGTDAVTPDYGMVFTWLQRDLDVLPELVRDVRWALDSVDFGLEQQEVCALQPDDPNSMTLASVLQWSEDLSDEGRTLLQDGGVRGAAMLAERAAALRDTLAILDRMIDTRRGGGVSAARLAMSRIRVPIGLLGDAVVRVRDRAGQIAQEAEGAAQGAPVG